MQGVAPAGFDAPIGDGVFMNFRTGQVYDTKTRQGFQSLDEMGANLSTYQEPGKQQGQGSNAGSAAGGISSTLGYEGLSSLFGGGGSAATSTAAGIPAGIPAIPTTVSASGTGTAALGGESALAGMGTYAGPAAVAALGAYGLYDSAGKLTDGDTTPKDWKQGAASLVNAPGVGAYNIVGKPLGVHSNDAMNAMLLMNPATAPLALASMAGIDVFGNTSKKHMEGKARQQGRKTLGKAGLMIDGNYGLADGSTFDISNFKQTTGRNPYDIDFSDPNVDNDRVNFLSALTTGLVGQKNGKLQSDMAGELYNAARSGGDFKANVRGFGDKLGGRDAVYGGILDGWKQGRYDANTRDGYLAAIDKEYGIANPNDQRWDAGLTGKDAERNAKERAKAPMAPMAPMAAKPQGGNAATALAMAAVPPKAQSFADLKAGAKPIPKGNISPQMQAAFASALGSKPQVQIKKPVNPRLKGTR